MNAHEVCPICGRAEEVCQKESMELFDKIMYTAASYYVVTQIGPVQVHLN